MKPISRIITLCSILLLSSFSLRAQDAGVTTILTPSQNDCGSGAALVKVIIYNYGSSSLSTIPAKLVVTGSGSFTTVDTLKKTVKSKAQDTLTFKTTFNTTSGGTFKFKVYTNLSSDANRANDTLVSSIVILLQPKVPSVSNIITCKNNFLTVKSVAQSGTQNQWYLSDTSASSIIAVGDSISTNKSGKFYIRSVVSKKDSLTTTFKAGNGQTGNMFDIKAFSTIRIDSFDVNVGSTSVKDTIEVYYKKGTYSGYEGTASAWTLLGKKYVTTNSTTNGPTKVRVGGLTLLGGGQIYGIYIRCQSYSLNYTNGTGSSARGDSFYNQDILIYSGSGIAGSFGSTFVPRIWNGDVFYSKGSCSSKASSFSITVRAQGAGFKKGIPFRGLFSAGTSTSPDALCTTDSIRYEIVPPTGLTNSDYGTKWTIPSFSFKSPKGYVTPNYKMVYPTGGNPGTVTFYPNNTYDKDSSYIMTIKISNTLASSCDTTLTRYILSSSKPTSLYTYSNNCYGKPVVFTNKSTPTISTTSYLWKFGDGNTSTSKSPSYSYPNPGTYKAVLYTYNGNCYDSSVQTIAYYSPTSSSIIKGSPFKGIYNTGSGTVYDDVLPKDTITYQLTPPKGLNNTDFGTKWYITNLVFQTVKGSKTLDTLTTNPGIKGNATLRFVPSTKWTDSTFIMSISLRTVPGNCDTTITRYIRVNSYPVADFNIKNLCFGKTLNLADASTLGTGNIVKWKWDFGTGDTSVSKNTSYFYYVPGTYTITLTVTTGLNAKATRVKTITIFPSAFNSTITKGSPFAGIFNTGNTPDEVGVTDTANYEIAAPKGYANSDYGTNWFITGVSLKTQNGSISKDTATFKPVGTKNWHVRVIPAQKWRDSALYLAISIRTSPGNCDTTIVKRINVDAKPVVKFAYTSSCIGSSIPFTDSTKIASGSISSWAWNFGDGGTSTIQSPKHTYTVNNAYTVKLTVVSNNGIITTYSQPITVYNLPKAGFEISSNCANHQIQFVDTSISTSGTITKWNWDLGVKSVSSTKQSPTYTYSTNGIFTIKLAVQTSFGCVDTLIKKINILPSPKADYTTTTACVGKSMYFINKSTATGSYSTFWDFGDKTTSTATSPAHTFIKNGSYKVMLVITSSNGCADTNIQTVIPTLAPVIKFASTAACVNRSTVIADTVDAGTGSVYSWNFGDGNKTVGSRTQTHAYTAEGSYTAHLTVTNGNGCVDSNRINIDVNAVPKPSFTTNDICEGGIASFNNTSTTTGIISGYRWSFGDGKKDTIKSPTHAYSAAGLYSAKLLVQGFGGCNDSTSSTIRVNAKPGNITWTTSILGRKVVFTPADTSQGNFKWHFGDGDSSSAKIPTHTYKGQKLSFGVSLTVTNSAGCKTTLVDSVKVGKSGIFEEADNAFNLNVYPNPFKDKLNISYYLASQSSVSISISDVQGRTIATLKNAVQENGVQNMEFDAAKYKIPAGVYMLKVLVEDQVITHQVIHLK